MGDYETTRQRHLGHLAGILPGHVGRLSWSAERIAREREERLRALLRVAQERSPWHAARLRGIDPDTLREGDLSRLPPMNKSDLMANWDAIVTDRRVTLDQADAHVSSLTSDAYLLDDLHVAASGGSSGHRGVFVFGWQEWATAYVGLPRALLWDRAVSPELAGLPISIGVVAAQNASHMTSSMAQTFANPEIQVVCFPVTRPMSEIVAGLNAHQPTVLMGYASALALLAVEARAGRLRIAPRRMTVHRRTAPAPRAPIGRGGVRRARGQRVGNLGGRPDGRRMLARPRHAPVRRPRDRRAGRPGRQPGAGGDALGRDLHHRPHQHDPAAHPLRDHRSDDLPRRALPVRLGPPPHRRRRGPPRRHLHLRRRRHRPPAPVPLRAAQGDSPGRVPGPPDPRGAEILVIGSLRDRTSAARTLESELSRLGVPDPTISFHPVDHFDRQATGKVRRFLPLA